MLDARDVLELAIRPALRALEPEVPRSEAAEQLLLGIAAQESGLRKLRQYHGGPARGLWQMEPATHDDLWRNWLQHRPDLRIRVLALVTRGAGDPPAASELATNLTYAAAMARLQIRRAPEPIPAPFDVAGFARLWKLRYNTPLGAGTEAEFIRAWRRCVSPIYGAAVVS